MIRHTPFIFGLLIPAVFLFDGCTGSGNEKQRPQGETLIREESLPLYPGEGRDTPQFRISLKIERIPEAGPLGRLIRDRLCGGAESFQQYGDTLIANLGGEYAGIRETAQEFSDMPAAAFEWEYAETFEGTLVSPEGFAPASGEFLVISRSREYFMGGAHGMREKQYLVIGTARNEQLTLDKLIPEQAQGKVEQLIARSLRRLSVDGGIRPGAGTPADGSLTHWGYLEDRAALTNNFFLTPAGLGLHWDPYEIAPYFRGAIEIVIPYGDLMNSIR
ncbi:MAG: RsiV family protein [Treponema sp.]|jgi:hypothetical protein|nr:RsiV family protein [Treponema sp.]